MSGKLGNPNVRARLRTLASKGLVQIASPGFPSCSKEMPSCRLHAEQLPQSPAAVSRKSARFAID